MPRFPRPRPRLRGRWAALARAAVAVVAALSAGCREEPVPSGAAPSAAPAVAPVDQLLPGEMAEGTERAFGLPIPRRMRVGARFGDAVFAEGTMPPETVANYVRERVIASRVETGPGKTVFTGATVKSAPERRLRIEVVPRIGATELVVRDETRPPAAPGLSEEERWRSLGHRPDGALLDPLKAE